MNSAAGSPGYSGDLATDIPACPEMFPELHALSTEELRRLQMDPSAFDSFIDSHPHTRSLQERIERARTQLNELQAEQQRNREELLRLANESGMSISEQLELEKQQHSESKNIIDEWLSRNSCNALIRRLEVEVSKTDLESKSIQQRYGNGEIRYEQFVETYLPVRKRYHLLSIALDNLKGLSGQSSSSLSQPS